MQDITLNSSSVFQNLGTRALDLWSQFNPEYDALAPVLCVVDFCMCSIPIGRNLGLSGLANIQAMGYSILENTLCC